MLNTPVDRIRCSLVGEWRVPTPGSSLSVQPSPLPGWVGVHITPFEACSSFTRVTACIVAHPPYVGFIARLRPGRFPGSDARKLSRSTNNLLEWVLPPLVICAAEAHPLIPFFGQGGPKTVTPGKRSPRTISISALPLSVAAFCGAKKGNPCLRKALLGQGEWPVTLQDTPGRDWKEQAPGALDALA